MPRSVGTWAAAGYVLVSALACGVALDGVDFVKSPPESLDAAIASLPLDGLFPIAALLNMHLCVLSLAYLSISKVIFGGLSKTSPLFFIGFYSMTYLCYNHLHGELSRTLVFVYHTMLPLLILLQCIVSMANDTFDLIDRLSRPTARRVAIMFQLAIVLCVVLASMNVLFSVISTDDGPDWMLLSLFGDLLGLLLSSLHMLTKHGLFLRFQREWPARAPSIMVMDTVWGASVHVVGIVFKLMTLPLILSSFSHVVQLVMLLLRHASLILARLNALEAFRNDIAFKLADASPSELAAHDDACPICRDAMSSAKRLDCGHMFHLACLRPWISQHASCPMCRQPVATGRRGQAAAGQGRPLNAPLSRVSSMVDSWLGQLLLVRPPSRYPASIAETMDRLRELFPTVPDERILRELLLHGSIDRAAESLLLQSERAAPQPFPAAQPVPAARPFLWPQPSEPITMGDAFAPAGDDDGAAVHYFAARPQRVPSPPPEQIVMRGAASSASPASASSAAAGDASAAVQTAEEEDAQQPVRHTRSSSAGGVTQRSSRAFRELC